MSDLVERLQWWGAKQKPPRGMDTLPADCREAASRISQQDAELEQLRRELAEVRDNLAEAEKDTHYWRVEYDKARKAAFIEAAEIAVVFAGRHEPSYGLVNREIHEAILAVVGALRANAEEALT